MRRKTFDALLTSAGFVLAIVLVAAGGLLLWAHNFVDNQVHSQLAAQQIFFPKAGSESLNDPAVKPYLSQYAGQQLVTGAQAEAYANHFIAVHINEMAGGKTYSQLSQQSLANPNDAKLAGQVQTVFRGETLRGLLLNAYAFGKMGQIALYAAITAFAAAGILLILSVLGYAHLRRVPADAEVMPKLTGAVPHTA
ncbi:hypothetical protein ACIA58_31665 [Kribbella sp. NPDC051586]|uniref:hypothetical protein n=1 Tax=Kribbella sp. NPDC051586 TaxID=3364118 RepID=UPI00378AE40A